MIYTFIFTESLSQGGKKEILWNNLLSFIRFLRKCDIKLWSFDPNQHPNTHTAIHSIRSPVGWGV